ncbi:site-specific integrase [Psychrobacillus sp. FSL K6-2843]|uniref:tyrosine-type recombinase/integrase n=1 Tax=Psychrobacillus sp. FSL K6-2843 TaxID=2921549 RepID=UPI003159ACB9
MSSYKELVPNKKYRLFVELGYDASGSRIRKTKIVECSGKRKAAELLRIFEHEVKESMHLDDDNPTFNDFAQRWFKNYAEMELEASTKENYEYTLDILKEHFGKNRIKNISTFQIVRYFTKEKSMNHNLEKKYNILKSIFKYAVLWKIIDERNNPMIGVQKPKYKRIKVENNQFFDKNEIPGLLKAMENLQEHQYLIAAIALFGGLRRGEVLALSPDVINWKSNQIHVKSSLQSSKKFGLRIKSTKTEDDRFVTYPKSLMIRLKKFYEERLALKEEMGNLWEGFKDSKGNEVFVIFGNEYGKPYRPDSVTQFWDRFIKREKLSSVSFHGLRHSSASYLLSEGVNMKVIQKRLGHTDIKTTLNMYSHINEDDDKDASTTFDKLFLDDKKDEK